jgi:uncharacterized protein
MKNQKWLSIIVVAFLLMLTACGETTKDEGEGGDDFRTDLQLGTGSPGGTYFPLGQEIATVVKNNASVDGINISAVSTGASVDNLAKINRGELQLGMTVHIPAQDAKNGTGVFDGLKVENFGFMGHIYPEVMQVVTLGSTGITSIEDLKGKRIAIGPPGSGTQAAAKKILEAHGIKDGDYTAFEEGFGDAKKKLQDKQIEATFGFLGLPASSINELQTQTNDVVFLEIKGEALERLQNTTAYESFTIEKGAYEWLDRSANTVTAYAILVGSTTQISEEVGYEITKALFENASYITHSQGMHITKENALKGSKGLDLHPGAERYFKEAGLIEE